MLSMNSESINFIFKNSFGFDILTVNGCFEEEKQNRFTDATQTLAIENLNNIVINFQLKIFFNFSLIKLFLQCLSRVSRNLNT